MKTLHGIDKLLWELFGEREEYHAGMPHWQPGQQHSDGATVITRAKSIAEATRLQTSLLEKRH